MSDEQIRKTVMEAFLTKSDKQFVSSQDICDECRPIYTLTVDEVTEVMLSVGAKIVSSDGNLVWQWDPESIDMRKVKI